MKKLYLYLPILVFTLLARTSIAQCPPPGFPVPTDDCPIAPTLCVNIDGYCATLPSTGNTEPLPGCGGNVLNNDAWFSFIAGTATITLEITPSNCQGTPNGTGMQGAIYEGDCGGPVIASQCNCSPTPFQLSGAFTPGQVYYVVFDGCNGDICDFSVAVLSGSTLPVPPPAPDPLNWATNVCPGSNINYTLSNPNESNFEWTVVPPTLGNVTGSPGGSVSVNWTGTGAGQLCVSSISACPNLFPPQQVCQPINSQPIPDTNLPPIDLCFMESVDCAGINFTQGNQPAGQPVTLTNWLGCDSVVICHINELPQAINDLGRVTLCAPNFLTICGQQYQSTDPFITHICPDGNWRGCDSTVLVDLAILDPQVVIDDPPVVGCGPTAEVVLNASSSDFSQAPGGTVTMLWTGPGILGPSNGPMVTINAGGVYCFTITTSRDAVVCTDQECVTVQSNIQLPQQPQISGNQSPCQGATATYTVTPVGSPAPTGYVWTTPGNIPFTPVGTNQIAITWPANFTTGSLCVAAENDCGVSTPACFTVTALAAPPVPVLSGPTAVCANSQTQVFTVTNAPSNGVTYNWQVPAGATFTGSGASITVNFSGATPGNGQVCVTAQNNCGAGQPVCTNFTITAVPAVPDMSGPSTVCSNGGPYTYTVNNPPTGVTYAWTVPNGATVSGATNGPTLTVNFNGASNGQVCVTASNACGTSNVDCQPVQVTNAPSATISGSGDICAGSNETVNLTITVSGTGPWDVSYSLNNGTAIDIVVPTSPYTLTVNQAGTYTLTEVSIQGTTCLGTFQGSGVVTQNPAPQATLSGTGAICEGSGQTVPLTIDFSAGSASPWTLDWTLNGVAQAPFQATTNPFTWNLGEAQAGNILLTNVVDGNGCDGTTSGSGTISTNDAPTVSNISADCESTNQFYIVTFTINGGDAATYAVTPPNGTLTGNLFTSNQIPTGTGYSFMVTDGNHCDTVIVSQNIVLCDCETEVGTMDLGMVEVCGNGPTSVQYDNTGEFFDGNDALSFVLHNGNGLAIVNPVLNTSSTPTVSFNPANMTYGTTYYLSAVVGDASGATVDLNDPCLQVAQGTPVVFYQIPSASIVSNDEICEGGQGHLLVQFTGGQVPYSISYDDGSGNIQTLNGITQNPYSLVVSPTATTTYCLTEMTDNNCTGTVSGCGDVVINTAVVVDSFDVECNLTSTAYTVTVYISGGDPASYSVTGLPGTLTGNVFVSNPVPSGTGYSLVVDDGNSCDPQTVAQTVVDCDCQTDAGSMSGTLVSVCGNGPVNVNAATGTFTDADDIIRYVLRPDNSSFLTTVIATSSSPTFTFAPATMTYGTTYYVTAVAGNDDGTGSVDQNDPCLSLSNSTPVVFNEIPTATWGGTQQICQGDNTTISLMLTGTAPWTITYQPMGGGTPTTVTANTSPFQVPVSPTATTTYNLVSVTSGTCDGTVSGSATVQVNTPPTATNVIRTCDPNGQSFTVSFTIQGGDPSTYEVTPPGTLIGNMYTSTSLPSGATYSFDVDDANGCGPSTVSGAHSCNCTTDLGAMSQTLVQACVDEMVTVADVSSPVLDPDDVLVYYLHTGNSNVLGTIIGTGSTPTFSFNPTSMAVGTTYYISAVAGTDSGNGTIDLQDPCLQITVGTPVRFNALPTITMSGSATICEGETASLTITVTGVGPFSVIYSINGTTQAPVTIPVPGTFPVQIPGGLTTTSTVALSSITDNGTGCDNTSNLSSTITVNPNVEAGTSSGDLEFCEGLGQAFDLDNQLTGSDAGGQWTGGPTGGVVAGGNVNPVNFAPGSYDYTYTVQGLGNCPDDFVTVNLTINPAPDADAGADQLLTCDVVIANLGGSGTTTGANYTWSGGLVANPNAATTTTTVEGTYTLTVESAGCIASDEVVITQSAAIPNMLIVISDVSCFGNNDGFVRVDSVWGGVGPYLFSVDGSPFSSTTQFTNLGEGPHTIQLMDAGGCENESSFEVEEPVEVTVEITGNFEGNTGNLIDLGDELVLSILSTPPPSEMDSILWSTQGLDSCQGCPSITVAPTQQTTYTVLVDENGCSASDDITVIVSKDRPVYVPTAFSPNDDGINDIFKIYGGKSVSNIKSFLVFDRWGETVYEYYNFIPTEPAAGWDGKHRDTKMQPAVFTWFAEIEFTDGRIELYRGDVTLVR